MPSYQRDLSFSTLMCLKTVLEKRLRANVLHVREQMKRSEPSTTIYQIDFNLTVWFKTLPIWLSSIFNLNHITDSKYRSTVTIKSDTNVTNSDYYSILVLDIGNNDILSSPNGTDHDSLPYLHWMMVNIHYEKNDRDANNETSSNEVSIYESPAKVKHKYVARFYNQKSGRIVRTTIKLDDYTGQYKESNRKKFKLEQFEQKYALELLAFITFTIKETR
ncbi:unnamed protein product [Didymodactylos carnosus]|uniref:Uncharacterized protein n=1 Tax=Didymodactylos carnosus TaxID=1234261 RepID=A0A814DG53_9BILA|nr:unnamed protein product [Didymodactylos carnosus]CAF3728131.1 unnamed protein product [Didymodactylos carnosus]